MSISVKIIGPVFEKSERSSLVREAAMGLSEMGINVLLNPLDKPNDEALTCIGQDILQKLDPLTKVKFTEKFVSIFMTGIENLLISDNDAVANIPWVFTEFDKLSYAQTLILNSYPTNEVWVPTKAQKEIFERSGVRKKIVVVSFGLDSKRFNDKVEAIEGLRKEGHYYFGMHTNLDPVSGLDIVLPAFYNQFGPDEKVHLIWKTSIIGGNPQERKDAINKILANYKGESKASVIAITDDVDEKFEASIFNTVDCYINPARGLGWGHNILRAMSSGKPVICNINTGNRAYTNHENSAPLTSMSSKVSDIRWVMSHPLYQDVNWFHISLDEMTTKMKEAVDGELKEDIGAKAKATAKAYTWDKVLFNVVKELKKYES